MHLAGYSNEGLRRTKLEELTILHEPRPMTRSVTHNLTAIAVFGLAVMVLPSRGEATPVRAHVPLKAHAAAGTAHAGHAKPAAHAAKAHAGGRSSSSARVAGHPIPQSAKATVSHVSGGKGRHSKKAERQVAVEEESATTAEPASRMRRGRSGARMVAAVELSTNRRGSRARAKARWRHAQEEDETAALRPAHLAMPAPLRGSYESLVHQNEMADAEGLERILDDADLESRIQQKSLVPVPVSAGLQINQELPENRRYVRPWTARFLTDLAQAHSIHFPGAQLLVTSAVRTVEYQRHLRLVNGNAAAAEGDVASPHLTGGTIDIAKHGLTQNEIAWLRSWLLPLQDAGKIDVEEEFKQACFHISVYKTYAPDAEQGRHKPGAPATAEQTADPMPPKGR